VSASEGIDARKVWVTPRLWLAVLRAVGELLVGRMRFGSFDPRDLPLAEAPTSAAPLDRPLIERVAYFVPRVARRMPFRSDCLVQAFAARRWLERAGIASELHIGSRKTAPDGLEAHAWLVCGDIVVTGWDIERFDQFVPFPPPSGKTAPSA